MKPDTKKLMFHLVINTILLVTLYFLLASLGIFYIGMIYLIVGAILGLAYVIYNRGFSSKGVTPEMLPDTMPYEKKLAFIEDGKRRLKKSRWMLTLILPIIVALCADMVYLYVFPLLGLGE